MSKTISSTSSVGQEIKQARIRKGLSQKELAKISGVSGVTIWSLESGRQANPQKSTLEKLKKALDMTPSKTVDKAPVNIVKEQIAPKSETKFMLSKDKDNTDHFHLSSTMDGAFLVVQINEQRHNYNLSFEDITKWRRKIQAVEADSKEQKDKYMDMYAKLAAVVGPDHKNLKSMVNQALEGLE
jgi:transcriptional regulator with XRE-family HTH domain